MITKAFTKFEDLLAVILGLKPQGVAVLRDGRQVQF